MNDAGTERIFYVDPNQRWLCFKQARRGEFPSVGQKNMGVADKSTTPRGWPAKHGGLGGMGMAGRTDNAMPGNLVPGGCTNFSDF
jgi:hypothetical protein